MNKLIGSLCAAVLVAVAVSGCGSSGDNPPTEAAVNVVAGGGAVSTPTPTAPADVTLTQVATSVVVTPGETFRITLLAASCPLFDGTQACKNQVPMGEVGFTTDLGLQNVKVVHDGITLAGYVRRDGTLYRFVPTGYDTIWQTGHIEATATLSPTAPPMTATVTVKAADASIDKTLVVVPGETKVQVIPLAYYAPAVITAMNYPTTTTSGFVYSCPQTVVTGCRIDHFSVSGNTSIPGTEVRVSIGENWWIGVWTDTNGNVSNQQVYVNYYLPPGGSIEVKSSIMAGTGSTWFDDIVSWSGDKQIAPELPTTNCATVNPSCRKG